MQPSLSELSPPGTPEATTALIRRLGHWRPRERADATQQLKRLGPAVMPALLSALQQERQNHKRRRRFWRAVELTCMVIVLGHWLLKSVLLGHWLAFREGPFAFVLLVSIWNTARCLSQRQLQITRLLSDCEDLAAIGPLLESLAWNRVNDRPETTAALTRLLPRLRASDEALLSIEQRAILRASLQTGDLFGPPDYLLAILQALEQIGDKKDLPAVQKWTDLTAVTPKGKRVKEAAQHCLAALLTKKTQTDQRQTLLRASSPENTHLESLVRPAQGAPTTEAPQLLRAGTEEPL